MNSFSAFLGGLWLGMRRLRAALLIAFATVLASALLLAPIAADVEGQLSVSPMERSVRSGDVMPFIVDWVSNPATRLDWLTLRFVAVAACFALFRLFLSGGLIEGFRPARSGRLSEILACSTRHFWKLLRLALLFLLPLAGVGFAVRGLGWVQHRLLLGVIDERWDFVALMARVAIGIALFMIVKAAFDYGRIALVRGETRSALRASAIGFRRFLARPFGTLAIYALLALVSIGLAAGYVLVASRIDPSEPVAIVALLAAGQGYIFLGSIMTIAVLAAITRFQSVVGPAEDEYVNAPLPPDVETPVSTPESANPYHTDEGAPA